jgi:hypothetical protein
MTETTTPAVERRWVDTAEAAKMIRVALKRAFPGVKFSVRSDRYAGGSSVSIGWTDGPTDEAVTAVTRGFAGNRFDGMDDLQYGADSWHCVQHGACVARTYGTGDDRSGPVNERCCEQAESVHFACGYVPTRRTLSPEFRADLQAQIAKDYGVPYDESVMVGGRWMSDHLYRLSQTITREV